MIAAEVMTPEQIEALERLTAVPDRAPGSSTDPAGDLPPAPVWPSGILPAEVEHYVQQQAAAIGVPVEMVAVPSLVFAGSTIGNAVELELKQNWRELPTVWACVMSDPGTAKSPALQAAQWPLNVLQKHLHDRHSAEMVEFEAELQDWEAAPKAERGEKPKPPRMDHLYSSDITLEALVSYLDHCRGLAIIRDELSGFIGAMDKYRSRGDDRQQYLSLWAGAPIKVDRKGGGTIYSTHPAAGVYGGIQPDYAGALHSSDGRRDGMVERFLLFRPDVRPARWTDDDIDPSLLDPLAELFLTLRTIADRRGDGERVRVKLDLGARRVWADWHDLNVDAIEASSGLRRGFYSKLPRQVARIALILHCLRKADDPRVMLSAETMRAAIEIGEFFRAHLDRVLPLIGDSSPGEPVGLPARILRYLRSPELQDAEGWVRRSELTRSLGNVKASNIGHELEALHEREIIERRKVKTGTKPAEEWRICPAPQAGEEVRL